MYINDAEFVISVHEQMNRVYVWRIYVKCFNDIFPARFLKHSECQRHGILQKQNLLNFNHIDSQFCLGTALICCINLLYPSCYYENDQQVHVYAPTKKNPRKHGSQERTGQ